MRVLVTGASGLLGRYVLAARPERCTVVGWSARPTPPVEGLPLTPVDLEQPRAVTAAFRLTRPAVVLHLAALATIGDCHRDPERACRINTDATIQLARLAQADGVRLVFTSTDLVFDGIDAPYTEDASPNPLSVYGRSKADAEQAILDAGGTVVRLSLLFGPGRDGRTSFFDTMTDALRTRRPLTLFDDEYRTPLDLASAAAILWTLAEHPFRGLLHAGGPERLSRLEMGARLTAQLGIGRPVLNVVSRTSISGEPRPADVSLDSTRLTSLLPKLPRPTYEEALATFITRRAETRSS